MTPTLLVIAGPTAVGKTALSIELARRFDTEIISFDSRQCYREMTIGTAKPTEKELQAVPHFFINSHSVREPVHAAAFERLALDYCTRIFQKKDLVIACGGTGLYLKALCEGLDEMPPVPAATMQQVQREYRQKGLGWLQQQVAGKDPEFFASAEQQNPHRLLRALAFFQTHGRSINEFRTGTVKKRPFRILKIALTLPRDTLYARINQRVEGMMEQGLVEEVKTLLPYRALQSLNTVGYAEIFAFLDGIISQKQAVEKIQQHTRNYAKRQLTWFKKDPEMHWFTPLDPSGIVAFLQKELSL